MENIDLKSFRLKSERRKKRLVKFDFEKKVRKKEKEYNKIATAIRTIPLELLEKPYQKGFVRFFVLREDIKKIPEAAFFEELLQKINTYMYAENRKFQKKRRKYGRRIYVDKPQFLKKLTLYDWNNPKLDLSEKERTYFIRKEELDYSCKRLKIYFEFTQPWRFVLRIRPNMITHFRPNFPAMEKDKQELGDFLDQHKVRAIICKKIYGGKNDKWYRKTESKEIYIRQNFFNYKMTAMQHAELSVDLL